MSSEVKNVYFDPSEVGSYASLYSALKNNKLKSVTDLEGELLKLKTYTLFKPVRKSYPTRKYMVHSYKDIWNLDLLDMSKFSRSNKGYKYIVVCIEGLSKKAMAVPIKNKRAPTVMKAFEEIIRKEQYTPKLLHTDRGLEFEGSFRKYAESLGIKIYNTYTPRKAILVERFNKTLRQRLYAIMFHFRSKVWHIHFKSVIDSYNDTPLSRYKLSPNQINETNQFEVLKILYKDVAKAKMKQKRAKFQVDNLVRISRDKLLFEKSATYNWTEEVFKIAKIQDTVPWTYRLVDENGEQIAGSFYEEQLLRVHPESYSNVLAQDFIGNSNLEIGLVSLNIALKEKDKTKPRLVFDSSDTITLKIPSTSSDSVEINGVVDAVLPAASFITTLNTKLSFFGNITFSIDFTNEDSAYITANVKISGGGYVILESILSQILGFDQMTFKSGRHKAKHQFNKSLLKATSVKTEISYVKYEEKHVTVQQPEDDSLDGLAETLHDSFRRGNETVFVTVDDKQEYMTFEVQKDHLEFLLPPKLCKWFQVPPSRIFSKKTSLFVGSEQPYDEGSREHLLVCLNLVDYQAYGSRQFPIIRTINLEPTGIKGRLLKTFEVVQYLPLLQPDFRTVSVTLILYSTHLEFDNQPSSAVLHIRKKNNHGSGN
ncbi:putative uncharacterized transposon-derived protein F54H12.3 [Orchesella cincta]|uniref:Uncharacterized transposon-derived protein F54H12.3 n=1 Tax=Orchesella cincta TaxID=48709 RepID=A0A1D2M731_ORCCI|nr:putative uncharacterized transposon-derived protein F54H12.3 [Orchesella cincta]